MKSPDKAARNRPASSGKRVGQQPQFVLIGQPNCGKSTIFNEVAGYRSLTSNFPGATVSYTESRISVDGRPCNLIDLPGVYSLTSLDPASTETQRFLLDKPIHVLINVIDASILGRSLELTLQLMDLEIPMILCLNMMDEAKRKGILIDAKRLSVLFGIPVIPATASKGKGVQDLFRQALKASVRKPKARHIAGHRDVEKVIERLSRRVEKAGTAGSRFSSHLIATKLLEKDPYFSDHFLRKHPGLAAEAKRLGAALEKDHGRPSDAVINSERHALSMSLYEEVAQVRKPVIHWKDRLDNVLMHNFWGFVSLVLILFLLFFTVFKAGNWVENALLGRLSGFGEWLTRSMEPRSLLHSLVRGAADGLAGGIAIILPYLLPFLLGLSLLEDAGYLPRAAFLMDGLMHRVGLHGTAVIPVVLGYGCSVPAVMSTRILESRRDRFIASFAVTMIPCAARMTVIFGLIGYYLGGPAAFGVYMLNLLVILLTTGFLSRMLPESVPGMLLEIPVWQMPTWKVTWAKTWMRLKEFIVIAWPLLIAGSVILTLTDHFNWTGIFNGLARPVTWLLGLPAAVGTTLLFGVLRKELSLLMLQQALGSPLDSVLSYGQMMVFTVFVVFYVPCVATIGVLYRQVGVKKTLLIVLYTFLIALFLGFLVRIASWFIA
ncbi:ferrous iron transport protein B [bacterium]|nr:ferrous iron transport protein B [bacterium]